MDCEAKIGVTIGSMVFFVLFLLVGFFLYIRKRTIGRGTDTKLKKLLKQNATLLKMVPATKTHDILLHCCTDDIKWVKDVVLFELETNRKRKCFLSYRDSTNLGKNVMDAIDDDLEAAANILIVISKKYLSYSWHAYYVKSAHRKAFSQNIPLAFLFKDDVQHLIFPDFCQIQRQLMHHTLVQWDQGFREKSNGKFWKELSEKHLSGNVGADDNAQQTLQRSHVNSTTLQDPRRTSAQNVQEQCHFSYEDDDNWCLDGDQAVRRQSSRPKRVRSEVTSAMIEAQFIHDKDEFLSYSPQGNEAFLKKQQEKKDRARKHWKNVKGKALNIHKTIEEESDEELQLDSEKIRKDLEELGFYEGMPDSNTLKERTPVKEETIKKSSVEKAPIHIADLLDRLKELMEESKMEDIDSDDTQISKDDQDDFANCTLPNSGVKDTDVSIHVENTCELPASAGTIDSRKRDSSTFKDQGPQRRNDHHAVSIDSIEHSENNREIPGNSEVIFHSCDQMKRVSELDYRISVIQESTMDYNRA